MNTLEELKKAFSKALSISTAEVTNDLAYQSIPEWDSISHIMLIEQLEHSYNISIEMEDVLEMHSIEKVKNTLNKYGVKIL